MQQLYPVEVFANTADFDTGIRQLLPRSDEMLEIITRCLLCPSRRILELVSSRLMRLQQCRRCLVVGYENLRFWMPRFGFSCPQSVFIELAALW